MKIMKMLSLTLGLGVWPQLAYSVNLNLLEDMNQELHSQLPANTSHANYPVEFLSFRYYDWEAIMPEMWVSDDGRWARYDYRGWAPIPNQSQEFQVYRLFCLFDLKTGAYHIVPKSYAQDMEEANKCYFSSNLG